MKKNSKLRIGKLTVGGIVRDLVSTSRIKNQHCFVDGLRSNFSRGSKIPSIVLSLSMAMLMMKGISFCCCISLRILFSSFLIGAFLPKTNNMFLGSKASSSDVMNVQVLAKSEMKRALT